MFDIFELREHFFCKQAFLLCPYINLSYCIIDVCRECVCVLAVSAVMTGILIARVGAEVA